ncbi:MAG: hypothetical protein A2X04_16095 [Bacteroidetes bacterium GWF2_41_9]|nr:MAG: hypothetical protein A2X04_16095 [Bacteroidetes bacterium GWF2_41_9]HBH84099.1 hypothetical protein [Bacteroidales bacterium]
MIRSFKILLIILPVLSSDLYSQNAAATSVLSKGNWFKIAVTEDGVYRIDYSKLKQIGLTNPSYPKLYGNNWGQLSYYNNPPKPDDLKEMAIYISGNDDVLNEGEYLLFFGKASHRWVYNESDRTYSYLRHNYSDTAYYFLTSDESGGKRITAKETTLPATGISISSDALFIHEYESVNLKKSGREWFQPVPVLSGLTINPGFSDLITTEPVRYKIRVAARAAITTQFRLNEGNTLVKNIPVPPVNLYNYTGTYANITEYSDSLMAGSSSSVLELKYLNNGTSSENAGWLDYLTLHGRKRNIFNGTRQQYSDSKSVAPGSITEFRITSSNNNAIIWEVSDQFNIKMIGYTKSGETMSFRDSSHILKTYIAFTASSALSPVIRSNAVPNQDLHGSPAADMIIVTHPLFLLHAQKLADIHQSHDGLVSYIVTPEQIYNEFSGGIPDIAAIRNFVRFKYLNQKNRERPLKYLLLFGDGSYENKTLPPDNPNFILTYQSQNSNVVVSSFTSDDFYGLLDDNEGEADGTEDIGIGRLPVSDTTQAGIVISKIQTYIDPVNMGDWKNIICLVADDEDGNTHLSDAEGLARIIQDSVPAFNIDKIYLDAFRQSTSANGQSYPNVNQAINDRINSGCLIFNYVGHGSENGLAHEGVLKPEDINSWQNAGKLPLFITATCEFSRFDDIEINSLTGDMTGKPSAGELVLVGSKTGAIALMSTTRVVYSAPNHFLNRNIFNFAFDRDSAGNALALGDIIRLAKNNSGTGPNKRNFTLLGDPALRLAYPWHGNVITDSVNNVSVTDQIDSLKALSIITIAGHVEDISGNLMDNFNGIVSPVVFDKEINIRTLANDGGQSIEFPIRNNILFKGNTKAKNGRFSFSFIVPRDIDYSVGYGKISYYASGEEGDMNGQFKEIIVGGFSKAVVTDMTGPDIKLFMNDTLFKNGGMTNNTPKLLAIIEDQGGINTTGSGIGHDLTAYMDDDPNKSFVLNNYFETDFDNFRKGRIVYDLTGLPEGSHTLTLKAWDNYNNSSVETIAFVVETDGKFVINNLMNYPNPFFNETRITAEHNRPDYELDITINIYNLSGTVIKIIRTKVQSSGFSLPPVVWDGTNDGGSRVGRGLYPYSVIISTSEGETCRVSGRMIIL